LPITRLEPPPILAIGALVQLELRCHDLVLSFEMDSFTCSPTLRSAEGRSAIRCDAFGHGDLGR
jgi:hypothetical protein